MATATVSGLTTIATMEGTPTITNVGAGTGAAVTTDVYIQGTQAIGRRVNTANSLRGFGVDFTAIDFTVSGRMLWVWWNAALGADSAYSRATGGYRIRVSSTLGGGSNYAEFYVGGGDVTATGAWNRTIIDIANTTPSTSSGVVNFAAIVNVSITYIYTATPGGNIPHVVLDAIHYGSNITVTGGTSSDKLNWSNVASATETNTNTWGVLRQPAGSSFYIANGNITFGSTSSNCYFEDKQQIIEWQDQKYYYTGLTSSVPESFQGITITNNSSSITSSFVDGISIGSGDTIQGSGGSIFQVPSGSLTKFHFIASNQYINYMQLYGTQIRRAQNKVDFISSTFSGTNHQIAGVVFNDCTRVNAGRAVIRNSTFQDYSGVSASLLWNNNINIMNCSFRGISSSIYNPSGIEHNTTGSFQYQGLTFDGNEYDILNSTASGIVNITASLGSNPSTVTASNGGTTNILNSVSHTVTDLEPGSRVIWIRVSDDAELANESESGGSATYAYNYTGDTIVDVQILSLTSRNKIIRVTLTSDDAVLPASQTDDLFYYNP